MSLRGASSKRRRTQLFTPGSPVESVELPGVGVDPPVQPGDPQQLISAHQGLEVDKRLLREQRGRVGRLQPPGCPGKSLDVA
jgi:hypothetical protein